MSAPPRRSAEMVMAELLAEIDRLKAESQRRKEMMDVVAEALHDGTLRQNRPVEQCNPVWARIRYNRSQAFRVDL